MKNLYNPKRDDEYLTVTDLQELLENLEYNKLPIDKLVYSYDLLGFLERFKLTKCGVSCYDSLGYYCYFRKSSKMKFYKIAFFMMDF